MTLKELGYQYLAQEKRLRERLAVLRALENAEKNSLLHRRIYYLSAEATDCRKIGRYLIAYYEKEERRD